MKQTTAIKIIKEKQMIFSMHMTINLDSHLKRNGWPMPFIDNISSFYEWDENEILWK